MEHNYKCHNAEPGTFNHECEQPAKWFGNHGKQPGPFYTTTYCDDCKENGTEAKQCVNFIPIDR